jgi:hypothetical protein
MTLVALVGAALAVPVAALAHLERPSYWPDPSAEEVDGISVGGEVPKARPLASALRETEVEQTHVVCRGEDGKVSLELLERSVSRAQKRGFRLRPSEELRKLTKKQGTRLLNLNERFARECEYASVQEAVFAADNHDRVVVMPGRYRERASRSAPLNDPKCADLTQQDSSGAETPSYEYQVTCPNDQNLIYVQGREVPEEPAPEPPLENRQGIPDVGPCVRCGLQIEGSGVKPEDVIFDGGSKYQSKRPGARPARLAKHVVLRIDRADGFVAKNLLARGAKEHGIYLEEVDGYLLDRTKFFWAADYGNLTFTSDHGVYKNCEGFGSGDSVVYPGAAPETGEQADPSFWPDAPRYNTVVKKCDLHGSVLAYSGSMGNAVRMTRNHIYGNTAGISSDTISAPGHPGYPSDSMKIDHNFIYSNNLDVYGEDPPVEPLIPMPIGSGIVWPGMNSGLVHDNWIFDNWRHGAVLAAVPDAIAESRGGPEGQVNPGSACETAPTAPFSSTSCGNRYFDNHLGTPPPDFEPAKAVSKFGNPSGDYSGQVPNGVDFWWDEFPGNEGNCWFDNVGPDGTAGSVTGSGAGVPPDPLPSDCGTSMGAGDPVKEAVLADCATYSRGDQAGDHPACYWFQMPAQPESAEAAQESREFARTARRFMRSPGGRALAERLAEIGSLADRP